MPNLGDLTYVSGKLGFAKESELRCLSEEKPNLL